MKAFFIKDLMLLKNQGKAYVWIILFYVVLSIADSSVGSSILGFFSILLGYFAVSTISYDEYQHGMNYLMALPVSRKSYVTEKYLFAIGLSGIMSIFLFLIELFYRTVIRIGWTESVLWETAGNTLLMVPIALLFLALAIPLHLKLGSERGKSMFSGLMLGFFFSGVIIVKNLKDSELAKLLLNLVDRYGVWMLLAGMLLYGLLIGLSYGTSVRILKKREF